MVSESRRLAVQKYKKHNYEKIKLGQAARSLNLKREVFSHYGLICACCGFDDIRALSIDHINNDGCDERNGNERGQKFSGLVFYKHLKKQGFPEGYQTLCMNCNFIKHFEFLQKEKSKRIERFKCSESNTLNTPCHTLTIKVHNLGFKVQDNGHVINVNGLPVEVKRNGRWEPVGCIFLDGKLTQFRIDKLSAYQKFGELTFVKGIKIKFKDGNKMNHNADNIFLSKEE